MAGEAFIQLQTLKQQVYEYIKASNGKLNPVQCASYLEAPPRDVEKAILRLQEEGKITIEYPTIQQLRILMLESQRIFQITTRFLIIFLLIMWLDFPLIFPVITPFMATMQA